MKKYIGKRIISFLIVLVGVSILSFLLIAWSGKDPAEIIAHRGVSNPTPEQIEMIRVEMGLDQPLPVRYIQWLSGMFTGELGTSLTTHQPIVKDLHKYLATTTSLVGMAILLCDVFIAFPSLIIAIAVIGVLGNGLQNIAVSVVIATWAWFVRIVRSYSVQEMGKDYILAARISGCNTGKLVFRHLIPNILPQFLVYVSTGVASSIIMVSSFAFLGLGLPSGTPEWGAMLNDARTALYSHPELLIYPGLCIFVTAAGFNLFGEALRDILTPEEDSL